MDLRLSVLLLVVGLAFIATGLIVSWLWRRGMVGRLAVGLTGVGLAWFANDALYPAESFYISELERLAEVGLPSEAIFVEKNASFPDHFGDYSACFIVRLNPMDMSAFIAELAPNLAATESRVAELRSCDSAGQSITATSNVRNIDLSPRATRSDANIITQVAEQDGLVRIEWQLW